MQHGYDSGRSKSKDAERKSIIHLGLVSADPHPTRVRLPMQLAQRGGPTSLAPRRNSGEATGARFTHQRYQRDWLWCLPSQPRPWQNLRRTFL